MIKGITEIAQALERRINTQRSEVAIQELDEKTDQPINTLLRFQYFPASITDSYTTNYVAQNIPGGSLPLYQWVSGGARSISFEAVFTCDSDFLAKGFTKGRELFDRLKQMKHEDRNVDIRSALIWLKRFMLPRYATEGVGPAALTYAPRKLQLIMPNSGIGGSGGQQITPDLIVCHMTQCETTYQMFHPSGLPKIVKVNLSFDQLAQQGGNVIFPSADDMDFQVFGTGTANTADFFGYPMPSTGRAREDASDSRLSGGLIDRAKNFNES